VPRSTWWRGNVTWLVPVALLLAAVIALGTKWRLEATTPAFSELQIPPAVEQEKETGRQGDMENGESIRHAIPR
jgi:hypothetical protein